MHQFSLISGLRVATCLTLAAALGQKSTARNPASPIVQRQGGNASAGIGADVGAQDEIESYRNAKPIVGWSERELTSRIPELKRFQPAESQEALALILTKVGENVDAFFQNFVNTTSVEEVRQERKSNNSSLEDSTLSKFNYLLLADSSGKDLGLHEYRTDGKGKPVSDAGERSGFLLTSGFASISMYFSPRHQAGSSFRLLGRKTLGGREAYLVVFAQRPKRHYVLGWFSSGGEPVPLLVQGVVWIDPSSYQILRMRTDLLAPQGDVYLEQMTTDIAFAEVRFKGRSTAIWLPRQVNVSVTIRAMFFHNLHRYSSYRLFNVELEEKPATGPADVKPD